MRCARKPPLSHVDLRDANPVRGEAGAARKVARVARAEKVARPAAQAEGAVQAAWVAPTVGPARHRSQSHCVVFEASLNQVKVSPAAITTPLGPLVPLYRVPPIVT